MISVREKKRRDRKNIVLEGGRREGDVMTDASPSCSLMRRSLEPEDRATHGGTWVLINEARCHIRAEKLQGTKSPQRGESRRMEPCLSIGKI